MIDALKDLIRPLIRPPLHRPVGGYRYRVHGSRYGGWPLLAEPEILYILAFGVGEDISFDLSAIKDGHTVHAFDPTPRSMRWVEDQDLPSQFMFHPWGIAAADGEATFYPPAEKGHVSYSAKKGDGQDGAPVVAPVYTLSSIMKMVGISTVDTLKMDIEGFEYAVLDNMIADQILPNELLIEFHHRMYGYDDQATLDAVKKLQSVGYVVYYVSPSGHEYGLVRVAA